jgi:hypothetical protein
MSRLSDHQIMALVRNGLKDPKRLIAYKDELIRRAKTGQLDRSLLQQVLCFEQNENSSTGQMPGCPDTMDSKQALVIAGDQVVMQEAADVIFELGALTGRGQAFGMMAAKSGAAQAQILKRIKDAGEYKHLNLTWEQFCQQRLGIDRRTAERQIAAYEEFGASYFALAQVMRISASTYRLIAEHVDDNAIEFDGEKIPITKANAGRIADVVASLSKVIDQKDERLAEHKRDADKLRAERNAAQKGAEKARQELIEFRRKQAERFPNADEDHSLLLDAQSLFDLAMAKLTAACGRELSEANQGRFVALTEYMYRDLIQRSYAVREKWGKGWNMAEPSDMLTLDQATENAANLIADHAATAPHTRKK